MPRDRKAESKTELDMDENLEAALCYIGIFFTGILFLLLERKSKFVRFHALQSTVTFVGFFVIAFVFNILFSFWAPAIFVSLVNAFILVIAVIVWIILIIRANQGEWYKLPLAGAFVEKNFKETKR